MGLLGDIGDTLFGEGADAVPDFTTPREQLTSEEQDFRQQIRGVIEDLLGGTAQDDPLVRAMRAGTREQISQQQQRGEEQLTGQLEQRGLQDSGIAAEALTNLGTQGLQAQTDAERQLQQLLSQRQMQGISQGRGLSGQDINLASGGAQALNQQFGLEAQMENQRSERVGDFLGQAIAAGSSMATAPGGPLGGGGGG